MKKSKNNNIILGFSFWFYEFGFSWCKGKIINLKNWDLKNKHSNNICKSCWSISYKLFKNCWQNEQKSLYWLELWWYIFTENYCILLYRLNLKNCDLNNKHSNNILKSCWNISYKSFKNFHIGEWICQFNIVQLLLKFWEIYNLISTIDGLTLCF